MSESTQDQDIDNLPTHVAIIMDGNRRWAKKKGLHYSEGIRKGAEAIKPIVERAGERGIKYITFWALSTENWKRGEDFQQNIFTIFREFLKRRELFEELKERGGQIHILGDVTEFPRDIQNTINSYLKTNFPTEKKIDVNFALNYGGRAEILWAVRNIIRDRIPPEKITPEVFNTYLYTHGQPDPDLIIRTSGEKRLSGYLPWQSIYAELYFTDVLWPDFTPEEFDQALDDFSKRQRRFGGNV